MSTNQGYFRQPTIHGDRIVFVCEDDLWEVPVEGGVARRLTAGAGRCAFPRLSPDGLRVAYLGRADGPMEVYVADGRGGSPRRLTWTGTFAVPVAWSPDGEWVYFASNLEQPFMGAMRIHRVAAGGGHPEPVPCGLAHAITFEPGGKGVVLGRNSGDPARWKRYRGGTAGKLWIDRKGDGEFRPLIQLDGNLAGPMWIGTRIYFLSDHEGHGNLYSCTPTGRGLRRHTHHDDFYVRFPSADDKRIVYHAGADLFLFETESGETRKLEVELHSPRRDRQRKFVGVDGHLETADLHPAGHSLAVVARGAVSTMGLWEGVPRRHDSGSAERVRLARWMPDGQRLVAIHDRAGEEQVAVMDGSAVEGDFGRVLDLAPAPAGVDRVALSNHRQEVWLVDLKHGKGKLVERSERGRIEGMGWSPDGRWLAYGFPVTRSTTALHLCDTRTGTVHEITRPEHVDFGPAFDPDGKYLYFLSHRVFDPVYDNQTFDLGFPRGVQPCLIPLAATTPSPFVAATRAPRAPEGAAEGSDGKSDKEKKGPPKVAVDLDGIEDRVVAIPVDEARYARIRGAPNRIFFSHLPIEGALDLDFTEQEPKPKATLRYWDLEKHKCETVKGLVSGFETTPDGKTLLLRAGERLRAVASGGDLKDLAAGEEAGRETGWIDLDRVRIEVEPAEEWRQMFREAWRLQRDQFWTGDMSQVDWQGVYDRYLPLVDRVGSRLEFSDLMWEMQGELGTSHCYELGGDYRPLENWYQGMLGADLAYDDKTKSWRIARIPSGDSWIEKARSPLAAPGLDVREGDELLAINGREVGAEVSPQECLVNQADSDVILRVRRGKKAAPREVAVHTLANEFALRYRVWVEANRARVHKESKGRVGYLHIPDMAPCGFAEFHRYFPQEMDREGLIIDVRWNGGGHVSQLLLEKLARKRVGYDQSRWQGVVPYPSAAPMGPMVALTNEYAGSDGDIFSHCFKLYGLGPLIGMRTWGGVVGIWPRHALVDGTVTTQPEFSYWFHDVGWNVENYGTDPDIEVDIRPQDDAAGLDPQLDRALAEVLKIIKQVKPSIPRFDRRPKLTPPRLKKPE